MVMMVIDGDGGDYDTIGDDHCNDDGVGEVDRRRPRGAPDLGSTERSTASFYEEEIK